MSFFSDSQCTVPVSLPAGSETYDCVLMANTTFINNQAGLGVFGSSCTIGDVKINGCTNVTGLWLNRRRATSSAPPKSTGLLTKFLLVGGLVLAWSGMAQAVTFRYDAHVATTKTPFCLHNINANRQDYTARDFIQTLEAQCGDKGSQCSGERGIMADYTMDGDRLIVDHADFLGSDRREQLFGVISGAIKDHVNKNDRTDCWNADDSWDSQIVPKSYHAFVYDCNDEGNLCNSAGNLKISLEAGWVRGNPDFCSIGGNIMDVAVSTLDLASDMSPGMAGALSGVNFFNSIFKMVCGLAGNGYSSVDCAAYHNREVVQNLIPYECKGSLKNVTFV
ncbi:hypothetical protein HDU97_009960 [Phlyctochytrium planicorne]|nr:hypothetical protein HDU97_009960 [Phlyctochytrium planicorne]